MHIDTFQCAECNRIEHSVTSEKRRRREQRKLKKRQRKKQKRAKREQTNLEEKNAKQSKYTGEAAEELIKRPMPEAAMSEVSTPSKEGDFSDSGAKIIFDFELS